MRHKIIAPFAFIVMALSVLITCSAAGATQEEEKFSRKSLSEQMDEINDNLYELSDNPAFGGFYYEGDTLIVNVVEGQPIAYHQTPSFFSTYPDVEVHYRTVKYSLDFLESVKDALVPQMSSFGISVLDANEATNQVDIYLSHTGEQVQSTIIQLIDNSFGISDFLNFIDYSNLSIRNNIGDVSDEPSNIDTNSVALSIGLFSHGDKIIINNHSYTLGPASSPSIAYTAGHDYSLQPAVYDYTDSTKQIGTIATSKFGGSDGDWGRIQAVSGCSFYPRSSFKTAAMGQTVYMHGGKSGWTIGTVKGTDQTVMINAALKPLTGMFSANYLSANGDSGAGIFSSTSNIDPNVAYGVHSSSTYYIETGAWAGTSYFTPSNKLS